MKKKISLILAAVLCLTALSGCKSKEEKAVENYQKKAQEAVANGDYKKAMEIAADAAKTMADSGVYGEAGDAVKAVADAMSGSGSNDAKAQSEFEKKQVKLDDAVLVENSGKAVIKSYAITQGYSGPQLILTLDYTNTNENNNDGFYNMKNLLKLYQDGAEIKTGYSVHNKDENTQIKTGATVEVVTTYDLRNDTSDVEIECYNPTQWGYGTGDLASTYTIKLKK